MLTTNQKPTIGTHPTKRKESKHTTRQYHQTTRKENKKVKNKKELQKQTENK